MHADAAAELSDFILLLYPPYMMKENYVTRDTFIAYNT